MATKNCFLTGIPEMLVLLLLRQRDCYAYEIAKAISSFSGHRISVPRDTIYTVAYKLEDRGLVSEYSRLAGRKRTRVYYHIEPDGLAYLEELLETYRATSLGVENILKKSIRGDG